MGAKELVRGACQTGDDYAEGYPVGEADTGALGGIRMRVGLGCYDDWYWRGRRRRSWGRRGYRCMS